MFLTQVVYIIYAIHRVHNNTVHTHEYNIYYTHRGSYYKRGGGLFGGQTKSRHSLPGRFPGDYRRQDAGMYRIDPVPN